MPQSGSYFYPVMSAPRGASQLSRQSSTEIVTLTSGSAATILSSSDVAAWSNIAITLINGVDNLGSIAVEFSPDDVNWEAWDTSTFASLTASSVISLQIAGNSRNHVRVRSTDTPRTTSVTASLTLNNG